MMHTRLALALTLLASFSLQAASLSSLFNPSDPAGRARVTTLGCVAGGALVYGLLNNFSDQLPAVPGLSMPVAIKLCACLIPGILIADYNADGNLDFSVLKGLMFWDTPSLQEAGASVQALVSMAGVANIIGGFIGASAAAHYLSPTPAVAPVIVAAPEVVVQPASAVAKSGALAVTKDHKKK